MCLVPLKSPQTRRRVSLWFLLGQNVQPCWWKNKKIRAARFASSSLRLLISCALLLLFCSLRLIFVVAILSFAVGCDIVHILIIQYPVFCFVFVCKSFTLSIIRTRYQVSNNFCVCVPRLCYCFFQVMISGPDDTPYSGGLFAFDIFFPRDYPQSPPKVKLMTTGGGGHRFNPNLYAGEIFYP